MHVCIYVMYVCFYVCKCMYMYVLVCVYMYVCIYYIIIDPLQFGVRIVPVYPPACRKRRLKGGVHGSVVVTFTATR